MAAFQTRKRRTKAEPREYDQYIVDLSRVTRVTKGGKQLSFRATVLVGDRKGKVGYAVAKGRDVQLAVDKAVRLAKKHFMTLQITKEKTIPHRVEAKYGSAALLINPAPQGSGLMCGGAVRMFLDLGGVENASSKILRGGTKINVLRATEEALRKLRPLREWQKEKKQEKVEIAGEAVV